MRDSVRAVKLASDLRKDLDLGERFLDLPPLLKEMGIELIHQALPGAIEGLTRADQIIVDPRQPERRRRFTVAHEVGHYLLGHGQVSCSGGQIHGRASDRKEEEANTFAAALLMPTRLFRPDAKRLRPRFEELDELADRYGVSLTAAVIRYVRFSADSCAVVGVRPPAKAWFLRSWDYGWFLALPPGEGTLVQSLLAGGGGRQSAGEVPARAWFENYAWDDDTDIREEVIQTTDQTWLVLLSEIPDFDDDPDLVDREARAELDRRRRSFRRY